jgi:hypothetical protein
MRHEQPLAFEINPGGHCRAALAPNPWARQGAKMSETPSNTPEYSVSEISSAVKRTVEDAFGYVRVRGELGRVSRPASGHIYTDLKDDRAVLSSVMWKGTAQKAHFQARRGFGGDRDRSHDHLSRAVALPAGDRPD